jgi:hypothetical protein
MEETPEEVLARLQRYVDSVKARGEVPPATAPHAEPTPPTSPAPAAAPTRQAAATVITAEAPHLPLSFGTVSRTIAGQVLCVATCVVTILLWINVAHTLVYVVVLGGAALCGFGVVRRVPFTGWVLIGLGLGLTLGRFS